MYQNSISNYEIIRRAAKKTVVGIYIVMYMVHFETTLRIEVSTVSTMNHLIDFGVCALVGCTSYIILHNYFFKIF